MRFFLGCMIISTISAYFPEIQKADFLFFFGATIGLLACAVQDLAEITRK